MKKSQNKDKSQNKEEFSVLKQVLIEIMNEKREKPEEELNQAINNLTLKRDEYKLV